MPFYGNDFFQAVEGHSDHIALGYMRLVWHYWTHSHCKGLKNDSEFLRKIARIERDQWDEAYAIIFDNDKFFNLDTDELWQQNRAKEEWDKALKRYNKACRDTSAATKARWNK
jgi:hypothetical protein